MGVERINSRLLKWATGNWWLIAPFSVIRKAGERGRFKGKTNSFSGFEISTGMDVEKSSDPLSGTQ